MKQLHWTQRPENAARLRRIRRAVAATRTKKRRTGHARSSKPHEAETPEGTPGQIGYAFGFTQSWLYSYAERIGVPPGVIAVRVGELLRKSSHR